MPRLIDRNLKLTSLALILLYFVHLFRLFSLCLRGISFIRLPNSFSRTNTDLIG